jgi:hypothetical protein
MVDRALFPGVSASVQRRDLGVAQGFFACGRVTAKGPKSDVLTYSVYRRRDLMSAIIPFFERYPLLSRKHEDFIKFREIVLIMQQGLHRTDEGFRHIVKVAFTMNQRGKQRRYRLEDVLEKPSETVRRAPVPPVKIQSDPHGDMRRVAEMTTPPIDA